MSSAIPKLEELVVHTGPGAKDVYVVDGTYVINGAKAHPDHLKAIQDRIPWVGPVSYRVARERNEVIERLIHDGRDPAAAIRAALSLS